MTSVVVVDHRQPLGEGRNRRALGDITNRVVTAGVKKPKPTAGVKKPINKAPAVTKKPSKSLSSVLTARSKAASEPKDPLLINIDEFDNNNELAQVEYVEDIYSFYKTEEEEGCLREDYMDSQPDINDRMRAILLDWLVQVHSKYNLMPETLFLTINLVDRYLSLTTVPRPQLQLVGICALLISSKYEEIWALPVTDMITLSEFSYSRHQILCMEKSILTRLGWYLTVPTPYVFSVRYAKASDSDDHNHMENMVFFFTELALIDYSFTITVNPSKLSASAVYAARCTLNKKPTWTPTLEHYTGYTEDQLRQSAKTLVSFHATANDTIYNAVYKKYATPDRGAVACFPPATSLLL